MKTINIVCISSAKTETTFHQLKIDGPESINIPFLIDGYTLIFQLSAKCSAREKDLLMSIQPHLPEVNIRCFGEKGIVESIRKVVDFYAIHYNTLKFSDK